jgi:hypothetical protein
MRGDLRGSAGVHMMETGVKGSGQHGDWDVSHMIGM